MATGRLKIDGGIGGLIAGTISVSPAEIALAAAIGQYSIVSLASGFNAIAVPTGTTVMVFVPPTANTQTLTLKGITGDTGLALSKTLPFVLCFATAPATVGITAGGIVNNCEVLFM